MPINDKQQAFINEYMINGHNASQAYKKAYPNCKGGWNKLAANLMAKNGIKQAIRAEMGKIREKVDHTRDIAIEMLTTDRASLAEKAGNGDIQAIQARTAITRELDAISNLHSSVITTKQDQEPIKTEDQPALEEAARALKLRLA
jgi:hypothetical protein